MRDNHNRCVCGHDKYEHSPLTSCDCRDACFKPGHTTGVYQGRCPHPRCDCPRYRRQTPTLFGTGAP